MYQKFQIILKDMIFIGKFLKKSESLTFFDPGCIKRIRQYLLLGNMKYKKILTLVTWYPLKFHDTNFNKELKTILCRNHITRIFKKIFKYVKINEVQI